MEPLLLEYRDHDFVENWIQFSVLGRARTATHLARALEDSELANGTRGSLFILLVREAGQALEDLARWSLAVQENARTSKSVITCLETGHLEWIKVFKDLHHVSPDELMTAFALPAIQAPGYDKALQAWAERVRSAAEIALGTTPGNSMLLNRWLLKEKHGAFFTLGESSEGLLAVHMPSTNETPGAPQPQVQIVSSDAATKMAQLAVSTCVLTGNLAAQWFVGKTGRGPNTSWDSLIEIDVRTLTLDEIADRIGTTSLMNWKWSSAAQ